MCCKCSGKYFGVKLLNFFAFDNLGSVSPVDYVVYKYCSFCIIQCICAFDKKNYVGIFFCYIVNAYKTIVQNIVDENNCKTPIKVI